MNFLKYLLGDEKIRNRVEDGRTTGFTLHLRYPNYRGMYLGYITDIRVDVDGVPHNGDAIAVTFKSGTFTLAEMRSCGFTRWNYGEAGEVFVRLPGGLADGPHRIEAGILSRGYLGTHGEYVGGFRDIVVEKGAEK